MEQPTFDQFIHGKFDDGMGSLQVIACTRNLEGFDFTSILDRYRFWGNNPPVGEHEAVGIFPYRKGNDIDHVVLVQVQDPQEKDPRTGKRRKILVDRYFYQYRYVFIPIKDLSDFRYRIIKLLEWLSKQLIPVLPRPKPMNISNDKPIQIEPLSIPLLADNSLDLDNERKKEAALIIKCLEERDAQSKYHLLKSMDILLHSNSLERRLLISNFDVNPAENYLSSICSLLPAIYRCHISIAVGNIDLHSCKWTRLIIIKPFNGIYARSLPQDCIWLDRKRSRFEPPPSQDLDSKYTTALLKYFSENSGEKQTTAIAKLIQELDGCILDINKTCLSDLVDKPDKILQEIPSLYDKITLILMRLKQSGLSSLAELIHRQCNLQNDSSELIMKKIEGWNQDSPLVKIIELLLSDDKIWYYRNHLPKFKEITSDKNDLSLTSIIEYAETIPDEWDSINETSKKVFSNIQERLDFFNLLLKFQKKFSLEVILEWLTSIAQDPSFKEKLIQKDNLAWQEILDDPINYIEQIFKRDRSQTNFIPAVKSLINCLPNFSNFVQARHEVLKKLTADHPFALKSPTQLQDYIALINEVTQTGIQNNFTCDEWKMIVPVVLRFDFPVEKAHYIANIVNGNGTNNQLTIDSYKQHSITSAKDVAAKLEDKQQTIDLLEKCQVFMFNEKDFIDIGSDILIKHCEDSPSTINALLAKFSDLAIYDKLSSDKYEEFIKCLSKTRIKLSSQNYFEENPEKKVIQFFINLLHGFISRKDYESLKSWKELIDDNLYETDLIMVVKLLAEQYSLNFFKSCIKKLREEGLNEESEIFRKECMENLDTDTITIKQELTEIKAGIEKIDSSIKNIVNTLVKGEDNMLIRLEELDINDLLGNNRNFWQNLASRIISKLNIKKF